MESYQKMVDTTVPSETPMRTASELSMKYFTHMQEIMEPMMTTVPETPQELMEHTMEFMKKASDLNMEFSGKYMEMYQDMMKNWDMSSMMGMSTAKAEPGSKKTTKKAAPKKDAE